MRCHSTGDARALNDCALLHHPRGRQGNVDKVWLNINVAYVYAGVRTVGYVCAGVRLFSFLRLGYVFLCVT